MGIGGSMPIWNRRRSQSDRISSERLADFGRWEFLKEQSGIDPSTVYGLVAPLNELAFSGSVTDRATLIAELNRHAERGVWEKVGAWKYVREFLDVAPDTQPLIDGGLLAVHDMRVTNLAMHLAVIDTLRYEALTGGPVPDDRFLGPPVFDSAYGPPRQYYFDNAVAVAAARSPVRLPSVRGVEPGPIDDAARAMWGFGLLVHRGPLVVSPEIAFEPNVLRPAIAVATNVDHDRFAELVVDRLVDPGSHLCGPFSMIGAARFIEEFLAPAAVQTSAYARALDEGLSLLLDKQLLGVALPVEILTRRTQERLAQLRANEQ
jgi:hypothetical protein